MEDKGIPANKAAALLLAAVIIIVAAVAALAGHNYGLFEKFDSKESPVPGGFIDETATHAIVEFINVGEGESVLVGSEGHFMLIDAGKKTDSAQVMKILEMEGVEQLDYILLSNPDSGHIGGVAEIIWRVKTGCLILPNIPKTLFTDVPAYNSMIEAAGNMKVDVRTAVNGHFSLGGCTFDTYIPSEPYNEPGDNSIYVRVCHGDNSFLLTGDSSVIEEEEMAGRGIELSSNVFKASNHAGQNACGSKLLSSVLPEYTVVSCGKENADGIPDIETLRRIQKFSPNIFMTSECGTVRFDSDGIKLSILTRYDNIEDDSSSSAAPEADSKSGNDTSTSDKKDNDSDVSDDGYYNPYNNGYYDNYPYDGGYYDTSPYDGGYYDTYPYYGGDYNTYQYDNGYYDTYPYYGGDYNTYQYDYGGYDAYTYY